LEKDCNLRYQSAAEMRAGLQELKQDSQGARSSAALQAAGPSVPRAVAQSVRRRPVIYAVIACVLAALVVLLMTGVIRNPFHLKPQERHLAVLPFLNIGDDPTDKAFAEGISETLTSKLSQLERFDKSFWVVPAGDARTMKSPDEAHRNLDVTLAITGSVERTPDGVQVSTNLIDAANHRQLASRTLNVPSISLEDLQQQVWEAVADMLDLQVPAEVKKELAAGGTSHPEAYRLYEQGNGYLQRGNRDDMDRTIDLFSKAVAIDPNYALAYAGLGEAYAWKYYQTKDPQWMTKATLNAGQAVELNDRLIPTRMSLAEVYLRTGQLDKALAEYKRVLEQDPTLTDAEFREATIYRRQGNSRQAEEVLKHVMARHSTYRPAYELLGMLYYESGRFSEAVQQFQSEVDLAPDNPGTYYNLGGAYLALGRYDDAISVLKKGLAIKPSAEQWSNLGAAYMYLGKWEEAADAMKRATELSPHNDVMWRNLGDAYDQIPSRLANAHAAYQKALQLATEQLKVNPKDPDVLSGIALYHAHLGQKDQAAGFILRALDAAPNNSDSLFTAVLVYELTGQREKALSAVDQAAKAGYSVEEIDKEPELRALRSDPRYKVWLGQNRSHSIANN
jgi:tetratricopeptide (TPR) repeat protein